MRKGRKLIFAEWYLSKLALKLPIRSESVINLSNEKNLGIQVKTINPQGDFVIKFDASDTFIRPLEWLHNYRQNIKARYEEARTAYLSLFPQDADKIMSEAKERAAAEVTVASTEVVETSEPQNSTTSVAESPKAPMSAREAYHKAEKAESISKDELYKALMS